MRAGSGRVVGRHASLALLALCVSCATTQAPDTSAAVLRQYHVARQTSPWTGSTGGFREDASGRAVATGPITDAMESVSALERYQIDGERFLAKDTAKGRIMLNERFFGPFDRPDATRLPPSKRVEIGAVKDPRVYANPVLLFSFLIESELIRTYTQLAADLSLVDLVYGETAVGCTIRGSQILSVDRKKTAAYSFRIELDTRTGAVTVYGSD